MPNPKTAIADRIAVQNEPHRHRIFIPYSHEDLKFARAFYRNFVTLLSGRHDIGYGPEDIFFDRGTLKAGQQWGETIENALESVEVLVLLVSPGSLQSQYCLPKEVATASQCGAIIPVILTLCPWTDQPIPGHPKGLTLGDLEAVPTTQESPGVKVIDSWKNKQHAWSKTVDQIYDSLRGKIRSGPKPETMKVPPSKIDGMGGTQINSNIASLRTSTNMASTSQPPKVTDSKTSTAPKKKTTKSSTGAIDTTTKSKSLPPAEVTIAKQGPVFQKPASDIYYILFCRIVEIKGLKVDEIAGAQTVLLNLAGKFDLTAHQASVYGRIYFSQDVLVAVNASKSLLEAAAKKGVRLAIGVARGRLLPSQDLGFQCLQGPAISTAARLATLKSAENSVVVDASVYNMFTQHSTASKLTFGEENEGKVKQTTLKYRELKVSPGSKKITPPTVPSTGPNEGSIVVYDIAGFSQKNEDGQWEVVNRLQKRVMEVASALNLQSLVDRNSLWYAPAGDGGALIFNGSAGAATAFEVAKSLASKCKDYVDLRVGVADGMIAVIGGALPVGTGVLRADTCSGYPPTGGICVDERFWDQGVSEQERKSWTTKRPEPDAKAWLLGSKGDEADPFEVVAAELLAEAAEGVARSLEQFPELKRALAAPIKSGKSGGINSTAEIIDLLFQEDLNKMLRNLWELAKSSKNAGLKTAIEEMMAKLPLFGVNKEWVRKVRRSLEREAGKVGGGVAYTPDTVCLPSAEILKAAVYGGPAQWSLGGGNSPRGENAYHPSEVESASTDAAQRLKDLEDFVIAKAGPANSTSQRDSRIKAFLQVELENRTPFYILLDHVDPLFARLAANANSRWKDALVMVRREGEVPVLKDLELTEEYIKRILQTLSKRGG